MKYILENKVDEENFIHDLLEQRGISNVDDFLNVDRRYEVPCEYLDNIKKGIEVLKKHIAEKNKINIVVDDDGDGFISSSLLYFFFKYIDYPLDKVTFLIHEFKYHGIELDKIKDDCRLLICPDSASSDYEQHNSLNEKGIDIIILDHHELTDGYPTSPNVTLINNQTSPIYENKALCGAGVTYKFIKEFCTQEKLDYNYEELLDLVAIAIIGDVMSLNSFENRYYIRKGLHNINNPFLCSLVQKRAYNLNKPTISPTDVAFYLVPAINAIVRVGTYEEKKILFEAICDGERKVPSSKRGHSPNETEIAKEQAVRLCDNAISRQKRERTKIAELLRNRIAEQGLQDDKVIIGKYYDTDHINSNLTGLAAMELANYYQRPALVVHYNAETGEWSGSARNFGTSIPDLRQFMLDSGLMVYAAGHANAWGCCFKDTNLEAIRNYCNSKLQDIDYSDNTYYVSFIGNSNNPNLRDIIKSIDNWRSLWGHGMPEPLLCVKDIWVERDSVIAMGNDQDSVKIARDGISFVRFKDLEFFDKLVAQDRCYVTIVGKANVNRWNGRVIPQIFIEDYSISTDYDF